MNLDIAREVAEGAAPATPATPSDLQQELETALQAVDDSIQVETPTVEESFALSVVVTDPEPPEEAAAEDFDALKSAVASGAGVDEADLEVVSQEITESVDPAPTKDGCNAPSDACTKACEDKKVGPAQVTLICPPLKNVCVKACEAVEGKVGKGDECKKAIETATKNTEKCELPVKIPGTIVTADDDVDAASASAVSALVVAVATVAAMLN